MASRAVERFNAQVSGHRGGGHAPPKPQLAGTARPGAAGPTVLEEVRAAAAMVTARVMDTISGWDHTI
jgi:hypothetical protein